MNEQEILRKIDELVEGYRELGEFFHRAYAHLVKTNFPLARKYLSQCDKCIEKQISLKQLRQNI